MAAALAHGPVPVDWVPPSSTANPFAPSHSTFSFDPSGVSEEQLRRDVAALLFRNVRDRSTWDHLGTGPPGTTDVPTADDETRRRVRVDPVPQVMETAIEFVDLPVGLGLLFDAATSEEFENPELRRTRDAYPANSYVDRLASGRASNSSRSASPSSHRGQGAAAAAAADEAHEAADPEQQAPTTATGAEAEQANAGDGDVIVDGDDVKSRHSDNKDAAAASNKHVTTTRRGAHGRGKRAASTSQPRRELPAPIDPEEASARIFLSRPPVALVYLLTLASSAPTLDDTCLRLYRDGMDRLARTQAVVEKHARQIRDEAQAECTFHPKTQSGRDPKDVKFKGPAFYKTTLEWQAKRDTRLAKKIEKENRDFEEEVMVKWKMNPQSVEMVKQRRMKERAERRAAAAAAEAAQQSPSGSPGRDSAVTQQSPPKHTRSFDGEFYKAASTPITNHRLEHIFRSAMVETAIFASKSAARSSKAQRSVSGSEADPAAGPDAEANDAAAAASPESNVTVSRSVAETVPSGHGVGHHGDDDIDEDDDDIPLDRIVMLDLAFRSFRDSDAARGAPTDVVERMATDIAGRRERAEKRADQFKKKQREKLYDKATGQPLFEPNSMPAAFKHGKRVPFEALSVPDQRDFIQQCYRQGIDIIAAMRIAKRHDEVHKEKHRTVDEVVEQLLLRKKQAEGKIIKARRKKAEEEARELESNKFKASERGPSAGSNSGYVPLHDRPLPKKVVPPPKPVHHSDPTMIQRVLARGDEFVQHRQRRIEKVQATQLKDELAELRPVPQINPVSDLLVQQRRSQLMLELEMMDEYQEEKRSRSQRLFDAEAELAAEATAKRGPAAPVVPLARPLQTALGAASRPRVLIPAGAANRPRAGALSIATSCSPAESHSFSPLSGDARGAAAGDVGQWSHPVPQRWGGYGPRPEALVFAAPAASPPRAASVDDMVDELLSAGRQRAPAHEPRVPAALQRTQQAAASVEATRRLTYGEATQALLGNPMRYGQQQAATTFANNPPSLASNRGPSFGALTTTGDGGVSPSLERLASLDDEAIRIIASPPPVAPGRAVAAERVVPAPAGPNAPRVHRPQPAPLDAMDVATLEGPAAAVANQAMRSKSVEEMLDVWKQLDRMSSVLLTDL